MRYNSRFAVPPDADGPSTRRSDCRRAVCRCARAWRRIDRFVAPRDFIWDDDLPFDLDGHGTHVAGTIGQLTNNGVGVAGMAYNVRIMPVKVIQGLWDDIFGSPFGTDDIVARGVRYAADNGANVINMSIGREPGGPATAVRSDPLRGAAAASWPSPPATRRRRQPANRPAQPAPESTAWWRWAPWAARSTAPSIRPPVRMWNCRARRRSTPGGVTAGSCSRRSISDLLETYERPVRSSAPPRVDAFAYYYFQGTSMATPHVSGFAAMLMQQGITDPAAIEAAMKQFATDRGRRGRDDRTATA